MAARGIKTSSLALDMKAPIALDGIHKAHPEQELLQQGHILCYMGSIHPCQAWRSPAHWDLSSTHPALRQIPFLKKGMAGRQRKRFKMEKES